MLEQVIDRLAGLFTDGSLLCFISCFLFLRFGKFPQEPLGLRFSSVDRTDHGFHRNAKPSFQFDYTNLCCVRDVLPVLHDFKLDSMMPLCIIYSFLL